MYDIVDGISSINIEDELKNSYLDYSMSVIIGRALPDVRDGLKPVHRRILFAMHILNNNWDKSYKKSARIVGDVIGKYHPHGDTAVYDAIVRMAQTFTLRYVLINGQGNFGSIDGDSAAAMRYTEIRMSKLAHELLIDLDKETVDFLPNYDNSEKIPNIMPTRIPNILINGSTGIAVGMATNIPPHNLTEVINGCLAYINNENISVDSLMKYIPGPDFPTSGIINGTDGIKSAYLTGKGKIYIRALVKIETDNTINRELIIISEIPYQVNKSCLIDKLFELVKEKRILGINCIRDESDKDGIRIVIEIKRDFISELVLNNLYLLTQLQISFGINMVALHKNQPKILSLKEILSAFISHRRQIVIRRSIFQLKKTNKKLYILESLILGLLNINFIIDLLKKSSTLLKAKFLLLSQSCLLGNILFILKCKKCYMIRKNYSGLKLNIYHGKYFFSNLQIKSILDLRLYKLTNLEYINLINEYKILILKKIKYNLIIQNYSVLMNVICKELIFIKNEYNDLRRTLIIKKNINLNTIDFIKKKKVVVTLSYQGYIKYQPLINYEAQHRGGKGKLVVNIKEKDFIICLLISYTHDTILMFSSLGRVYWLKVYKLPECNVNSRGRPVVNLLPLDKNEHITTILSIDNYKEIEKTFIFMATSSGIVKKTPLLNFSKPRTSGIIAINLQNNDKLIGVVFTVINDEIMLFSAYGKVVCFLENQVRSVSRFATGVCGINLSKGDNVVALIVVKFLGSILIVTQNGYGKRTLKIDYPIKSRAIKGVISIKVSKRNGKVVGAVQVNDNDQVIMITDAGTLVRIRVSEVNIIGRNTQGVRLIRTTNYENVVGLQRIFD